MKKIKKMENSKQTINQKRLLPNTLKKAVIFVAGTTVALAFFYSLTLISGKVLKNIENL
jgi:hypothetical protein